MGTVRDAPPSWVIAYELPLLTCVPTYTTPEDLTAMAVTGRDTMGHDGGAPVGSDAHDPSEANGYTLPDASTSTSAMASALR